MIFIGRSTVLIPVSAAMSRSSHKLLVAAAIVTGGFLLALPFRRTEEFKTQHAAWEAPVPNGQEVGLQPYLVMRTTANPSQDELPWTPSDEPSALDRELALPPNPLESQSGAITPLDRTAVAASAASLEIETAASAEAILEPTNRVRAQPALAMPSLAGPAMTGPAMTGPATTGIDNTEDASPYRLYVIQNGDSLQKLAARYLGSDGRALELFDLNRDVLSNPHLLPIGSEIRIPRENHLRRK